MGWRLDAQVGEMVEKVANAEGWLWSEQLESWLVPDWAYLRLYERNHQMHLTGEEAQTQQVEIATERAAIEAERAKIADEQAKAAMRKAEALAEKLRSLGINPDEI